MNPGPELDAYYTCIWCKKQVKAVVSHYGGPSCWDCAQKNYENLCKEFRGIRD